MFDIRTIKSQFPSLTDPDEPVVYLDSAATTQKPKTVIDCIGEYYLTTNANVHRGSHHLTAKATKSFEQARKDIAQFINADSENEIVWTRGTTEGLNLIANTWGDAFIHSGDEIVICENEHHANIVPWQLLAQRTGARIIKIPVTPDGGFDLNSFEQKLSANTKLVSIAHITNVTGYRQPVETVIKKAHLVGAIVVVDGAQGIVHEPVNVQTLDADFYVFSGHKLYGPTGIGVLYGKYPLLQSMPPWHGGGKMVDKVSFSGTTFADAPAKFEAGTPNIAGAIALAEAVSWYQKIPYEQKRAHLRSLQEYAFQRLSQRDSVAIIGYQPEASIISFTVKNIHHQDIATLLDQQGVAVRSGHHCAHPLMDALSLSGTIRLSFGLYNDKNDIDKCISALDKAIELFE
ncbi:aminotransferase class V-fold PLP-dependent enzyme [Vibrio salinus]|uniref:aminotransferase class V-fold PLP-dependent enzyme n=1 Tax=Vibrio salinus TaxID=2899784 RepID=UPI001E3499CD|nr:SufS family cysteine desulfurase [Vibrio salinus]MCE0494343.1 SufS family cysteine desulfurase [Vibrio salinus]